MLTNPNSVRLDDSDDDDQKRPTSSIAEKYFFESRIVMVTGQITHTLAERVCLSLFALSEASDDPITVIISSPGGHVESGDMVHDTIKFIKPRVRVLGSGWVASAGALIYIAAEKEDRYVLENTRFLLHAPSGGVGGKATDIAIQAREIQIMRDRLNQLFANATGQTLERVEKDTDRDFWLSANEAVDYGLATHIISKQEEIR